MQISRRTALLGGAALGASATSLLSGCNPQSKYDLLERLQLDAALTDEGAVSERGTMVFNHPLVDDTLRKELRDDRLVPAIEDGKLRAVAVVDAESPNYGHLAGKKSADGFVLTAALLGRMADANGFSGSFSKALGGGSQPQNRRVAFGLRGCSLVDKPSAELVKEIKVKESDIDHIGLNCVMGVWDRVDGTVAAFPASTVPHVFYMQLYRIYLHLKNPNPADLPSLNLLPDDTAAFQKNVAVDWQANQLGQGLHLMSKGTHKGCPNLFVQDKDWYGPILRAKKDLAYRTDDWDESAKRAVDNIHPAWAFKLTPKEKTTPVEFASAGCNLISGTGFGGFEGQADYGGHIKTFLALMAKPTDGKAGSDGDWDRCYYMLLTGREAHQHVPETSATDASLARVRFGSSGAKLGDFMKAHLPAYSATNVVNRDLHYQIVSWQTKNKLPGDGVVTQAQINLKT